MNHPRLIFAVMAAVADENAHMKFLIVSRVLPTRPLGRLLLLPFPPATGASVHKHRVIRNPVE
jgi:hypothetical protein